jgi:HD-GYP domain-containing protein (c-di-GMP phosphodiesterase class II)
MRQHTIIGERMLHVAPALAGVAQLVRWSHERVDGGGYPDMTSDRPYRRAVSADAAVADCCGMRARSSTPR